MYFPQVLHYPFRELGPAFHDLGEFLERLIRVRLRVG